MIFFTLMYEQKKIDFHVKTYGKTGNSDLVQANYPYHVSKGGKAEHIPVT